MSDCKWCDPNDKEWEYKTFPYDFGELGKYELSVSVSRLGLCIEFSEEHSDPIFDTVRIDIKYCPYCGRKLAEDK